MKQIIWIELYTNSATNSQDSSYVHITCTYSAVCLQYDLMYYNDIKINILFLSIFCFSLRDMFMAHARGIERGYSIVL